MKLVVLLFTALLFSSCATKGPHMADQSLLAVNWFQTAGEVRALQYQAFESGKIYLRKALRKKSKKPRAIIVDIDETVLDNSPYQGWAIKNATGYPDGWKEWILSAKAEPIPGAVKFLNYAARKGVVTFYVSNRKSYALDATYKNLKEKGFPVKKERILLRTKQSAKGPRRELVSKTHNIILLAGDNLGDFHDIFDKGLYMERNASVDKMKRNFGTKFLVLPNPMYGSWEGAMAKGYFRKPAAEKDKIRRSVLKSMK